MSYGTWGDGALGRAAESIALNYRQKTECELLEMRYFVSLAERHVRAYLSEIPLTFVQITKRLQEDLDILQKTAAMLLVSMQDSNRIVEVEAGAPMFRWNR